RSSRRPTRCSMRPSEPVKTAFLPKPASLRPATARARLDSLSPSLLESLEVTLGECLYESVGLRPFAAPKKTPKGGDTHGSRKRAQAQSQVEDQAQAARLSRRHQGPRA